MATILNVSIDLSKIDKSKINKTDKNGQPFKNGAQYYNLQVFVNDTPDKFGNTVSVAENQSKEQREAKEPKKYLGNGKVVWTSGVTNNQQTQQQVQQPDDDGLPF